MGRSRRATIPFGLWLRTTRAKGHDSTDGASPTRRRGYSSGSATWLRDQRIEVQISGITDEDHYVVYVSAEPSLLMNIRRKARPSWG